MSQTFLLGLGMAIFSTSLHIIFLLCLCLFVQIFPIQLVKNLPAMQETPVRFLGWEDPVEKNSDVEHLFICFWPSVCLFLFHFLKILLLLLLFFLLYNICMSSLRNYLFRYSAHFLIWLFVFLTLSYKSCLYTWDINPLSITLFANIFFHMWLFISFCFWFPLLGKSF